MNFTKSPYIIKEAALLFESDAHKHLDAIIGVSSPIALRMKRSDEQRPITKAEVVAKNEQANGRKCKNEIM